MLPESDRLFMMGDHVPMRLTDHVKWHGVGAKRPLRDTQMCDGFRRTTCRSLYEQIPTVEQISGTGLTGHRKRAACGKLFRSLIGRNGIVLQVVEHLQFLDQSL